MSPGIFFFGDEDLFQSVFGFWDRLYFSLFVHLIHSFFCFCQGECKFSAHA